MTETDVLLTGAEVARLLRRSPAWFSRHRHRLQAEHAFPPPRTELGGTLWPRAAVLAWIERTPADATGAARERRRQQLLAERADRL